MKSIGRTVTVICMAVLFLAGCTGRTSVEENGDPSAQPAAFTIGMLGRGSPKSSYFINVSSMIEKAGGRLIMEEYDHTPEGSVTAVENLVAAGCDGIIIMPLSDHVLSFIAEICEESGTYWTITLRTIHDPRIRQKVEASPYFVGMVMENEEEIAYNIMKTLGEQGVKKVAAISINIMDTTGAAREKGMNQAAKDFDMDVVDIVRDPWRSDDVSAVVESLINAYPDLDAIFSVGAFVKNAAPVLNTILELGKADQIRYATVDFDRKLIPFFEQGMVSVAVGGHVPLDANLSAALLVNKLMGTPLKEDGPVMLQIDPLVIQSGDEMRRYFDVVEDGTALFSAETANRKLFKWVNPDITVEDFQALIADYSIDTVLKWKSTESS